MEKEIIYDKSSEEYKAIKLLESKTTNYSDDDLVLHYNITLYNLIINLMKENKKQKEIILRNKKIISAREEEYKKLEREFQELKLINKEYERLNKENGRGFKITSVKQYDIYELLKYKNNWNYIKEMLKEVRNEHFNIKGYCETCTDVDIDFLLNKMKELEGDVSSGKSYS